MQGIDICLKQIYEIDTVFIESNSIQLSIDSINSIVESAIQNIFSFTILSNTTAIIEFIKTDDLKKWLVDKDTIQKKFNIKMKLDVKCVDEDYMMHSIGSDPPSSDRKVAKNPNAKISPSQMFIYLGRGKKMIANHPTFGIEYKNYIRT